ncbi:MAG: aminotransferase class V-fold PLP-dependent enzyme [Treponema sp.]|jgi:cysteine desulfurase|nr:aminotransferase class V-fold PLP-dependent enzyme [Treponema sp.]
MVSGDSAEVRHYFDWAATAIPDPPPAKRAPPFGNPSSAHKEGRAAREALEAARARCAAVLGVAPETLYFTSGGTESNCIALHSTLLRRGSGRLLVSAAEHSSVRENAEILERLGKPAGRLPVDSSGRVSPELFAKTLEKYGDVRFAAIMAVNNETGVISDMPALRDIARNAARKHGGPPVHLHCDLVQAAGKVPVDISGWDLDSASLSAHKIGGPRGIGLLYLRRPLEVLCSGGGQERKMRPGTENTAGALALAACLENHAAAEKIRAGLEQSRCRWKRLLASLKAIDRCVLIPAGRETGDETFSPYIVQTAFKDIPGEVMVRALDDLGFAVSTGSACSSASPDRPVLAAMGIGEKLSLEGIRISQGWSTSDEEIDLLLAAIAEVLKFL